MLACSPRLALFSFIPQTNLTRVIPATVGYALQHESLVKKIPQSNGSIFSTEEGFSNDFSSCQADKNLKVGISTPSPHTHCVICSLPAASGNPVLPSVVPPLPPAGVWPPLCTVSRGILFRFLSPFSPVFGLLFSTSQLSVYSFIFSGTYPLLMVFFLFFFLSDQ